MFPIVIVIGVFAYTFFMRGRMRVKAQEMYGGAMTKLREALVGDANPICIIATERKMLSARIFYVGISGRRLVLLEPGKETRTFERGAVQLSVCEKTWSDSGNMTTTISRGWELRLVLPDGSRHTCRVYGHADGIPDHQSHVQALVCALQPRAVAR
jgi:hypothetical protein